MQYFLRDPDSRMLNLETHRLALATAKKTLDENRFKTTQKTMARDKPAFQVDNHVYFKNKQPGKWDLKWRPEYRIVGIECDRHFIHIKNHATGKILSCNVTDIILELPIEFWDVDTQFSRAGRYINHPANFPTIKLNDSSLKKKPALLSIITPLLYSTLFMLTPTTNSSGKELGESVIFHPVLQAYQMHHFCIITAHVSLRHLACHWKAFNRQLARTQQLLHVDGCFSF